MLSMWIIGTDNHFTFHPQNSMSAGLIYLRGQKGANRAMIHNSTFHNITSSVCDSKHAWPFAMW